MARPPSSTVTRSTLTVCWALARCRFRASICMVNVRVSLVIARSAESCCGIVSTLFNRRAIVMAAWCVAAIWVASIASISSRGAIEPITGMRAAALDDYRIHDNRHTHASHLVSRGMSLPIVGRLLGHPNPSTTQRYAHLADDPLRAAAEIMGRKLKMARK